MKILAPIPNPPLRDQDPRGRLDVAVYRLLEKLVKDRVEPAFRNKPPLWDAGLGDLIETALTESRVLPNRAITARDVYHALFGNQRRLR